MERFTKRYECGHTYVPLNMLSRINEECVGLPITKLARYEDLEEKRRLLELPCAVGDTLYIPVTHYYFGLKKINEKKVLQATAEKIEISESGIKVIARNGSDIREFFPSDFWKTIFTDREQAKQALQEMKQEQQ